MKTPEQSVKDEFIDFVYTMYLQNTNGRETHDEMFRLGIEFAYDEMKERTAPEVKTMTLTISELNKLYNWAFDAASFGYDKEGIDSVINKLFDK